MLILYNFMKKVENYMEKMKKKIYNFVNMAFAC